MGTRWVLMGIPMSVINSFSQFNPCSINSTGNCRKFKEQNEAAYSNIDDIIVDIGKTYSYKYTKKTTEYQAPGAINNASRG
jgi:hypothetical protein